ncbi:MAG: hypothetical protein ACRD0K_10200 [Egibacteraceae bacterium]
MTDLSAAASPDDAGEQEQAVYRDQPAQVAKEVAPPETQAAPGLQIPQERSWEDGYRARLELIWEVAHASSGYQFDPGERQAFLDSMVDVLSESPPGEREAALTADMPEAIPGDVGTVELVIDAQVPQLRDPTALERFVRYTVAPTMRRLERRGEGTYEQRVDAISSVLSAVRGTPATADLAWQLVAYLQGQAPEDRGMGFYTTIAILAVSLSTVSPAAGGPRNEQAGFCYHLTVEGMRWVAMRDELDELDPASSGIVSSAAFNLASGISTLFQRRGGASDPDLPMLRELKAISAATASPLNIEEQRAADVVQALGFHTDRHVPFATVLSNMGSVTQAWVQTQIGRARLEATSGVVDAASDRPEHPAARLFNAGVSLGRARDAVAQEQVLAILEGRFLLNAVGLRIALTLGGDLIEALIRYDGLDCAVNFVATFAEYRRTSGPETLRALEPLTQELLNLTTSARVRQASPPADIGRLLNSAQRLNLTPKQQTDFSALPRMIEQAIEAIRAATNGPALHEDQLLDSARLVRHTFATVVPQTPESAHLQQTVDEVVASRDRPVETLIDRYAPYARSPEHPVVGIGPLVPAGVVDPATWDSFVQWLSAPAPSMVPALQRFQL